MRDIKNTELKSVSGGMVLNPIILPLGVVMAAAAAATKIMDTSDKSAPKGDD